MTLTDCVKCLLLLSAVLVGRGDGADKPRPLDKWDVLSRAQHIELLSLDPSDTTTRGIGSPEDQPQDVDAEKYFHGWKILGTTSIKDEDARKALLNELYNWIEIVHNLEESYLCFVPRHGIRASLGGTKVEVVICFECYSYRAYVTHDKIAVRDRTKNAFDDILRNAGVPLPGKEQEE